MPARIAARLVTGPAAFLVAWVLDVVRYTVASLRGNHS
jgi:hypothetical protein